MPRLPTAESLGERPVPQTSGGIVPFRGEQYFGEFTQAQLRYVDAGQSLVQLGASLLEMNAVRTRAKQAVELSDALSKANEELSFTEAAMERDPDFDTLPQRFEAAAQEIGKRYGAGLSSDAVRRSFDIRYRETALSKRINILKTAVGKEQSFRVSNLDNSLDVLAREAAAEPDQGNKELIANHAGLMLSEHVRGGWITEVQAEDRENKFQKRVDYAQVIRDGNEDPGATATRLMVGGDYAKYLEPVDRERLEVRFLNLAETRNRALEAAEEKRIRGAGDAALMEAYSKLASGTLIRSDIEKIPQIGPGAITPAEYKGLLDALVGGGTTDNPAAVADVERLVYANPESARKAVFGYHARGMLTSSYLSSTLSRVHGLLRQEGPRSSYERDRQFIVDMLSPSEFSMDPSPKARMGLALQEYDDWYTMRRDALKRDPDPPEIRAKSREIVKRISIINMEDMIRKTAPGASQQSDPQKEMDRIKADVQRVMKDRDEKRITPEEYQKRMRELQKQREAAEKAMQMKD